VHWLDCEYTDVVKNVKQRNLPPKKKQHAALLQLYVASETVVFQICHADVVLKLLRKFLNNDEIMSWGATIQHDVQMLEYYGITISGVRDLQRKVLNPTLNYPQVFMLRQIYTLRPIFPRMIQR
jgi:hypothetical protein